MNQSPTLISAAEKIHNADAHAWPSARTADRAARAALPSPASNRQHGAGDGNWRPREPSPAGGAPPVA